MFKRFLPLLLLPFCYMPSAQAQQSYYTLLQGGGQLGVLNPGNDGTFNGYTLHFIFGRNFDEKAFLGFGLGNETLRGDYSKAASAEAEARTYGYDRNLFPIFIDARLPFADFGAASRIGALANAGYSLKLGAVYDKGPLAKIGFFYLHDNMKRSNFTVSASYAYQQLNYGAFHERMNHQSIQLAVGLMLK